MLTLASWSTVLDSPGLFCVESGSRHCRLLQLGWIFVCIRLVESGLGQKKLVDGIKLLSFILLSAIIRR